jgi:hypothetical protein
VQIRQAEWGALATAFQRQQRAISIDVHGQEGEELSEKDYHRLADLTLGEIMVKLESLIEETPGLADSDLEYSQVPFTEPLGDSIQSYLLERDAKKAAGQSR